MIFAGLIMPTTLGNTSLVRIISMIAPLPILLFITNLALLAVAFTFLLPPIITGVYITIGFNKPSLEAFHLTSKTSIFYFFKSILKARLNFGFSLVGLE